MLSQRHIGSNIYIHMENLINTNTSQVFTHTSTVHNHTHIHANTCTRSNPACTPTKSTQSMHTCIPLYVIQKSKQQTYINICSYTQIGTKCKYFHSCIHMHTTYLPALSQTSRNPHISCHVYTGSHILLGKFLHALVLSLPYSSSPIPTHNPWH